MTERAKHAAHIRNQRQARDEVRPPSGSSKNTKKWCRGVVGREHNGVWMPYTEHKHFQGLHLKALKSWRVLVCTVCGKELEMDYGERSK